MLIRLRCRHCAHAWELRDEPRLLMALSCPNCKQAAPPRAVEDLASSLEDALCQLHQVGEALAVHIELSDESLPPAFVAAPGPADGQA